MSSGIRGVRGDSGFTLIELLMTVSIIGILSIVAIPQFNSYRQRVYDTTAKSDIAQFRNAVINAGAGSSWSAWQTGPTTHSRFTDVKISPGVKLFSATFDFGGGAFVFFAYSCHPNGKQGYFMYVPYGSDPWAGWGWSPNRIDESVVYYAIFC